MIVETVLLEHILILIIRHAFLAQMDAWLAKTAIDAKFADQNSFMNLNHKNALSFVVMEEDLM